MSRYEEWLANHPANQGNAEGRQTGSSSTATNTGSATTSPALKTTAESPYAITPKKNTTPTAIKSWEKQYTNEQLNARKGRYESKAAAHGPVAYTTGEITPTAIRAQERAGGGYTSRVQQLNPTPTTIRAMENQYNEQSGKSTYGRSKWTATSDDPISQAYAKGLNMWGDTKTWAEQSKQASERASAESETKVSELEAQIKNLRMLSAYGTQIWDGGVYMGRDEELKAEYDRQIAALEKQIEQQKASATSAAEEYEIAQAIYDNELQITTDKQNRDKAKARGLNAEEWYTEAIATKDSAWDSVQELEDQLLQVQSYVDRFNALKGTADYDADQAKKYENLAASLQTRLDNARTAYNDATADLESATRLRFEDVQDDPDYAKNVTAGAAYYSKEVAPGDNEREVTVPFTLHPSGYEVVKFAIDEMAADNSYLRPAKTWTSDELKTYYYLIGADNNDMTRADDYAREVNAKYANAEKNKKLQQIQEWATKNFGTGVASSAAAVGTFLVGGLDMAADALEYIARGEITTKSTPSLMEINGAITSAVSDVLNDKSGTVEFLGEERGLGDMYQVAMSVGESLASIAIGGEVGSLAMFFGSAGASGIDEALERGATPGQAITYGVLKGGIEVLTEKVSVENLLTNVNVKTALQSILMQAGVEASEEGMSTLLGTIADAAVMDDKSDLNVARYYYLSLGYTMEEANKKASTEWLNGLAWDTITGALSGGLSAGLKVGADAVVSNTVGEGAQQRAAVKANVDAIVPAVAQRLQELGQTQNVDETARAIASKAMGEKTYNNWLVQLNNTTQQVYDELANAGAGTHSSAWAEQALEQITAERETEAAEIKEQFRTEAAERIAESEQAAPVEQQQPTVTRPAGEFKASYKGQTGDVIVLKKTGNSYAAWVELPGGKVVNQKEENLTFDSNTQELIDYARPYEYGDEMAMEYMKGSSTPNPQLFTMEFSAAADLYGRRTALSEQAAYNYAMKNADNQLLLTREQFGAAFRIGRQQAENSVVKTAAVKHGTGELHFGKDISYGGMKYKGASENMVKPSELEALRTLAKATGIDIYFFEAAQDMNGRYKGANGFYRNGNIYLDVHAMANKPGEESAVLLVAAHEMTHYLKENNQEGYLQLRDFVVEHLMEEGVNLEELIDRKLTNDKELAREDALEEVIADSCEMMLENTRLPDIMARENPSLLEQIRDWLRSFAKKIAAAFKGVTPYHEEARAMVEYANELQTIWDNAMAEAVRNSESASEGEAGNGNSKFSYRGKNEEGIEVYETSEETKELPYSERKKKYIELMRNQYQGRTAKFEHDGIVDYALFTGTDIRKDMYGDKKSDERGRVAKMNVAADGDVFTLVENAEYIGSRREEGKKNKAHKNVLSWDYFVKTVQIDGRIYDVLANVRKTASDSFVYSIQLNENKSETVLPAQGSSPIGESFQLQVYTTSDNVTIPHSTTESKSKYSMRDVAVEETAEQKKEREKSYADLKRRNAELERQLEHLRKQTKKTQQPTIRKGDTDRLASSIAKELGITDREVIAEVKKELQTMGDNIVQSTGEELSYTELKNTALDIADYLLQNVEVELDNGATDSYRELREYLKGTTLKVNSSEMKELDETWRKRNFGKVNLSTKKGLPIDVAYNELTERFGEGVFPPDVYAQSDMLYLIDDYLNAWKPRYGNPYEANMNEVREYYAQEILNSMLSDEIRQTPPTYADRADAKLQREKARTERQKQKNREQREQYEARLSAEKQRRQALDKRMKERVEQVRAEGNERLREAVKKERTFQLQRQERAQKLKNIDKISNSLMRKLTENSGKNHVPDFVKEPVAQLLSAIDPRTARTGAVGKLEFEERMNKLADVIKDQRAKRMENSDELTDDMFIDFDPAIAEQIKTLAQRIKENASVRKEWKLDLLDLQTLQEFEDILHSVSQSINEINEFYATNSKVSDVSRKTTAFLDELGAQSKTTNKFLAWDNLTPVYFFNRLGEGGKTIFKLLTKGWGDFAFKLNEIKSFTESLYQAKEAIEANNTIVEVQLHNKLRDSGLPSDNTVTVKMSKAQIMSLYGLWLRGKQALDHVLGAGITLTDIKRNGQQTITQNDNYVLTMQELTDLINDNLTAREMQIVRELVKFMSTVGSKWGNAVTQKRWGIDKFTEEHYFPISTDKRSRDVSSGDSAGSATGLYRLVNFGFTKELTPNSTNPVVIDNVFDVFANHMSDMAKYGSLALPLLDMMKWVNYREISGVAADGTQYTTESVRKAMDIAYGRDAQNYLTQFIRDLNSSNEGGITGGIEKAVGRYKRAAVGANLRVAILQPTSIARAAMEISPKYIAEGMANVGQLEQSYREAMMYSGAAMWKSQGFYDVNVNRSMRSQIKHDETLVDHIVDKSMVLAELGDKLTWSQLWTAAKAETTDKAKRAGERLTEDELMSRTADRFEEIIYLTQVMDSTLTRSQLMRSKDNLAKAYTAFMAEPTLSYNTLMGKYFEFNNESRRTSRQAAWQKLGGKMMSGFAVYAASQIFTAAAESVMDAWRDDDDYMTFAEKWLDKFWGEHFTDGNLAADLSVLQKLPIVKDVINALQGEESSRMELEGAGSLYTALKTTADKIEAAIENGEDVGKVTNFGWIMQVLRAASQISGLPGYNMTREVVAIWNNTIGTLTGDKLKSYKANPESEIKTAFVNGYLTEEEAKALLMDKETMGDRVYFTDHAAETKIADWENDGTAEMYEALYDAMEAGDKNAFEAAIQTLTEDGNRYRYDVIKNARSKIKEWYVGDEHGATKLNKEMAEEMFVEFGGYSKYEAHNTVHQLTCAKVEGFNYSERKQLFLAGDLTYDEAVRLVQTYGKDDDGNLLYDYADKSKAKEAAEKEVKQWQMVLDTKIDFDERRSAYDAGEITDEQLKAYDMEYGSMDEESADAQVYLWKWKGGDERLNSVTGAQARRYDDYIAGAGVEISKAQYVSYISGHLAKTFSGDLKPGTTNSYIPNSKRDKIWEYIDTLPLTPEEKDAMAVVYAYDADTDRSKNSSWFDLQDAPWNQ